jgi:hypothetical protein
MDMDLSDRVAKRFKRAQLDALDFFIYRVADQFLDALSRLDLFAEKNVSMALLQKGLDATSVNKLTAGKTAGPLVKALGGLIARGLWYALIRPFLLLAKIVRSASFRSEIKADVRRALRKEVRETRHMFDVASRWQRGDTIHPQELKAAKDQMLRILVKLVLVYFATAPVTGLFQGGLWKAIQRFAAPAEEILILLLDRPLTALLQRLRDAPV